MHRLLPFLSLLLATPLVAQENLFSHAPFPKEKTRVEVTGLFSRPAPGGYFPVRVTIVNKGKNDATLKFTTTSSDSGWGNDDSSMASTFELGSIAGETSSHDLLVPLTTTLAHSYGINPSFSIRMSGSFGANSGSLSAQYADKQPAILMSEVLYTPNASTLDTELNTRASSSRSSSEFAAKFDPTRMPEDWRAYSGFDAIILTDGDWGLLSPGARNAILQWTRMGGRVDIRALNAATNRSTLGIDADSPNYGFGAIDIQPIKAALSLNAGKLVGHYLSLSPHPLNHSIRNDYSSSWPLQDKFGKQAFSYFIFIIVLILFGILVGPVNLFVFAKSGMRHKLFITTPLISLGTSALLIIIILLKDGMGGSGHRVALIEVRPDSGENAAYILQEQVSRTGVLIGSSFDIDEPAAVTPVPIPNSPWARLTRSNGGGGMRYNANFQDNRLRVSGDWFQSRSEQGQLVRAVVPTRGRIELKSRTGDPVLISTFDFPVESLYFIGEDGNHWIAKDVAAGKPATATPLGSDDFEKAMKAEENKLGHRHRLLFKSAIKRPNHFIALASDAPGVATFDTIDWTDTHTILAGPIVKP